VATTIGRSIGGAKERAVCCARAWLSLLSRCRAVALSLRVWRWRVLDVGEVLLLKAELKVELAA
jgi:hypothetical protein